MKQGRLILIFSVLFALFAAAGPFKAAAAYDQFAPGSSVTLGEFVYDDNMQPTTTPCTLTVMSPAGAVDINAATMSSDASGWHYYSFTASTTLGTWPTFISCGSQVNGDLIKENKTFIIASSTTVDNSAIADSVWNSSNRTLTSATSVAGDIWNSNSRSLTDYGTTSIATAVWLSPSRTLTSFGSLVSDITTAVWSSGSRTLTAFGSLAADVWNNTFAPSRRLTDQTLESGGSLATKADVDNATSTIVAEVLANRTLINNLNNISASDVWAYGTKDVTLSNPSQVWNVASSSLTTLGSVGKHLVDNLNANISSRGTSNLTAADVWLSASRTLSDYATSSVAAAVWNQGSRTLTNYGNDITAADVWNVLTSSLTTAGSVGSQVAGVSTSTVASAVWLSSSRTLTDYATSSIASAIWLSPSRTLTSFGTLVSDIATAVWSSGSRTLTAFGSLAADVWNNTFASTRRLTDQTLTSGGSLATQSDVNNATSSIITEVLANRTLINNLNNISASDVWAYGARTLTSAGGGTVDLTASSTLAIWNVAKSSLTSSGSIGKTIADNLDATISSRGTSSLTAADVWLSASRTLSDYSTSSLASAVWSNGSRTLTNYGNNITAADVWNVMTSSLTTAGSVGAQVAGISTSTVASSVWNNGSRIITGQQGAWITTLSETGSIMTGKSYRVKYYIYNSNSASDPYSAPQITLYDADRNVVVSAVAMTRLSTGVYEYVYSVASGATQGAWETIVSTQVENGRFSENTDYWEVKGAPAQVIIREVNQTQTPDISANITITNEGSSGYEYTYEWCVVSQVNNSCGGGNDVFYASAAKFILPGENWDTSLTATVSTPGNYYFKLVVYFGSDSSGASRSFTATSQPVVTPPSGGGGGGGGGGYTAPATSTNPDTGKIFSADINQDGRVDAVDFSILLYYWKTKPPFANPKVDINGDGKVDAIDFSILLYNWTAKK
ncbi:MAG: hypothetical protein HY918_05795 [Candidatus Doudnabacteria bacterium]|nr:hypothetical protein [Candidatus Doudnabacteria bacterium]